MQYHTPQSCPIVLACDEAYAMPLATTLRSIAESNRAHWPLDVNVLTEGVSEQSKSKVLLSLPEGSTKVRWIPVDTDLFRPFGLLPHVSRMTYARLLIPHLFADAASKVLYLDVDILVLRDLAPLWQTDLEGVSLAAVLDYQLDISRGSAITHSRVGMPSVPNYFNAGVLLINTRVCLLRRVPERALEYLRAHTNTPYSDQDALNVACDGDWMQLDPTWNFQIHQATRIGRIPKARRPAIVHFNTRAKPWLPSSVNVNAWLYDRFRSRTRFRRSFCEKVQAALETLGYRVRYRARRLKGWLEQIRFKEREELLRKD